jgi:hypothetical protein
MSIFSKRTVIALACVTAVGALTATPSLAGVVTPTDKTAVSTASPIDSVYHRWCGHRYYHHAYRVGLGPVCYINGLAYWGLGAACGAAAVSSPAAAVAAPVGVGLFGLGLL